MKSISDINSTWDSVQGKLDEFRDTVISMVSGDAKVSYVKNVQWMKMQKYHVYPSTSAKEILRKILQAPFFATDIETTGKEQGDALNFRKGKIAAVTMCCTPGEVVYIPFQSLKDKEGFVKKFLVGRKVVYHGGKFDIKFLWKYDTGVRVWQDTMMIAYHADINGSVKLDELSKKYFNLDMLTFDEMSGGTKRFDSASKEMKVLYACADSDITLRLFLMFVKEGLARYSPMLSVTTELSHVLGRSECRGIMVDVGYLKDGQEKVITEMQELEEEIYREVGFRFNMNSSQKLATALFGASGLNLPIKRRSKTTNKPSASAIVLKALEHEYPIVAKIAKFKRLVKGEGSYLGMLQKHVQDDGAIHTSFLTAHVPTYRLSCCDPSLHNIPKWIEDIVNVRDAFYAREGFYFVEMDYSQIEFRLFCYFAAVHQMIKVFENGGDPHRIVSGWMFRVDSDKVDEDMRDKGKTINFGVLYGMEAWGLAERLGCTQETAAHLLKLYFKAMTPAEDWKERKIKECKKEKSVEMLYGTRRRIPYIDLKPSPGNKEERGKLKHAERGVINTIIQGSAAEVMRISLVKLDREIEKRNMRGKVYILLTVHDSALLEVHKSISISEVAALARAAMEFPIKVYEKKIPVDIKFGDKWGSLKSIDTTDFNTIEIEVKAISRLELEKLMEVLTDKGMYVKLVVAGRVHMLKKKLMREDLNKVKGIIPSAKIMGCMDE